MKKNLKVFFINYVVFCSLLVTIEIGGQCIFYLREGHFLFDNSIAAEKIHRRLFEIHPYLAGRLKKNKTYPYYDKTITTTSEHTRWTGAPINDTNLIRIATVGGSTTFGTGLTDVDTWPALLQNKLGNKYSVTNYGIPGGSTAEAIIQTALLLPEKKPRFIIQYHGWNDIRNYHEKDLGIDYYGHGYRQFSNLGIPLYEEKSLLEKLKELSSIVWLANKIKDKITTKTKEITYDKYSSNDPFVDRIYRRNLETLLILSKRTGAQVIFVPQVMNNYAYKTSNEPDTWARRIENKAMPLLMERFNKIMEEVCNMNKPDCIYASFVFSINWEDSDFIDFGHFSRKGGDKFIDIIYQLITEKH